MRREFRTDCTRGRETVSSPRSVASAYKPEVREIVRVSEVELLRAAGLAGSPAGKCGATEGIDQRLAIGPSDRRGTRIVGRRDQGAQVFAKLGIDWRAAIERADACVGHFMRDKLVREARKNDDDA